MTQTTKAYAVKAARTPFVPYSIERRDMGPDDVAIDIKFCGVCHTDVHHAQNEWGRSTFPMVPGHEIVGIVAAVGSAVSTHKPGDRVGVGCFVDSCRVCVQCRAGEEQFCVKGTALTYNGTEMDRKTRTFGGYSTSIVVDKRYVLQVPAGLDLAAAAPLLCAGITTYSPLRHWNCKKGDRVAVVGLGGLGHMAVKLAASMGADVTLLSTSRSKEVDAKRLGASSFELTSEPDTFKKLAGQFDMVLDTVSAQHDYNQYLSLLRPRGAMIVVGAPAEPTPVNAFSLLVGSRSLAGSMIGGIRETQEMLDYCGEKGIVSDVEIIPIQQIDEAFKRIVRSDVRYRFVIDVSTL